MNSGIAMMLAYLLVFFYCICGYMCNNERSQVENYHELMESEDAALDQANKRIDMHDRVMFELHGRYVREVQSERQPNRERIRRLRSRHRKQRIQEAMREQEDADIGMVDVDNNVMRGMGRGECTNLNRNKEAIEKNGSKEQIVEEYTPCPWREEHKRLQIEKIKRQILHKLKMSEPPNISMESETLPMAIFNHAIGSDVENGSDVNTIEDLVQDIYDMMVVEDNRDGFLADEGGDDGDDDTVRFILMSQPVIEDMQLQGTYGPIDQADISFFNLGPDVIQSKLVSAHLYFFTKSSNTSEAKNVSIEVFKVIRSHSGEITIPSVPDVRKHLSFKKHTARGKIRWARLRLSSVVNKWIHNQANLGLYIVAHDADQDDHITIISPQHEDESYKSILDVKVMTSSSRRHSKRALSKTCPVILDEPRCCMFPLLVDFNEFGWDWIIKPHRFQTFYCAGNCPQKLFQEQNETRGPCCAPVKMSPISLLYYDHTNHIVAKKLRDIVVHGCGCT